jgi:hypothetical protein
MTNMNVQSVANKPLRINVLREYSFTGEAMPILLAQALYVK